MLIIKWTQPSGIVNLIETKTAAVMIPKTPAFKEYKKENPDLKTNDVRGMVFYDGGTIILSRGEKHLYVVNENGKTVQTV